MEQVIIFSTVLAPIILALTQLFKTSVKAPKNIIPLVSVAIGLLVGLCSSPFTDLDIYLRLWSGLLAGLSATGLFELTNTREGTTKGGDK